ncbi:MAG: HAD family hydrolase [Pirellulales bacterium]|nr:HAD family hydrolase [Pirellulales bacterium]
MFEDDEFATHSNNSTAQRALLVLDVDETLLHAAEAPLQRLADFRCGPYFVFRRPHVREFLLECAELFQLAVWSSSSADYLNLVLAQTVPHEVPLAFVWSRNRCVQRYDGERHETYFVKDLKKVKRLGFDLARVLIVDDTPQKLERNYGNAVYVRPYFGDPGDNELPKLASYLRSLATVEDVRRIEKRGWRTSVPMER